MLRATGEKVYHLVSALLPSPYHVSILEQCYSQLQTIIKVVPYKAVYQDLSVYHVSMIFIIW